MEKTQQNQQNKNRREVRTPTLFARNIQMNGMWNRLSLSDSEVAKVERHHREYTVSLMQQCLDDAKEIVKANTLTWVEDLQATIIAKELFNKRCHKIFTLVSNALDEKARRVRGTPTLTYNLSVQNGEEVDSPRLSVVEEKIQTSPEAN